jgi:chloramphenicol-sensitive protein RarD
MSSPTTIGSPDSKDRDDLAGVGLGLAAFLWWGLAPVYFKSVGAASAPEILCHRIVWSVLLLGAVALFVRRGKGLLPTRAGVRRLPVYLVSSLLISSNWLLYIGAVNAGHVVDSSLGYYINPLVNVLLGMAFLGERLNRRQGLAIAIAAVGVVALVLMIGRLPWLSLALPLQFGLYGLVRKKAGFDPLMGLLVETALLFPAAMAWLFYLGTRGELAFLAHGPRFAAWLAFAGVMTAVPLLLFLNSAQRLRLSTLGVIQYASPTCQLIAGVFLFGEEFTRAHAMAFAFIWAALALYSADAFLTYRQAHRDA